MMASLWIVAVVHFALTSLAPNAPFEKYIVDRGVQVDILRVKGKSPWIRGTFEVPAPPDKVIAAVTNFKNYKELFAPGFEKVTVLESSADSARLHLVWPYPSPLRDRDAVVVYKVERFPSGGAIVSWHGEARPTDPKTGVRIEHVEGETRIEPAGSGTKVVYTYVGDLGGNFPESIKERAWKGEPVGYMQAIRRAVGLPFVKKEGSKH